MTDAFYQIELEESSRPKTAFAVQGLGTFMFKRMPMGLCNFGATLCELIDSLFGVAFEPETFPYIDDFIVATNTFDEHIKALERVAEAMWKSKFCQRNIKYLGHIMGAGGARPDPAKVEAIVAYPAPKTVREIRRFLGMVGWYQRFIKDFSTITTPMTELLKKEKTRFSWTEAANDAFEKLKQMLVSVPVLATPDYTLPFVVQTDASDVGIGAVLTQEQEGAERVIAYMSQKLSSAQRKYHVTERECLAVLLAIEKFRPYIEGVHFTVITDHASLLWLQNLKEPTGRLARWSLRMQRYDFELTYRKGALNVVPDALSRAIEALEKASGQCSIVTTDPWYIAIQELADSNGLSGKTYVVENGNVYCNVRKAANPAHNGWKLCVPQESVNETIRDNHDNVMAAHGGFHKTLHRLRERYFWPDMKPNVQEYLRSCDVCKRTKATNENQRALMGGYRDPIQPFRMIALDFVGPFPISKLGNQFLLVIVDLFSKYVVVKPIRKSTARITIDRIKTDWFTKFGVPEILISDNGPQLISKMFTEFLDEYGVTHWPTAVYHPQANPTEAANKTIGNAIRAYIKDNESHKSWDESIADIAFALNSAVHSTSKHSPHQVVFGKPLCPFGLEYNEKFNEDNNKESVRRKNVKLIREKVTQCLRNSYEANKKRYNLRSGGNIQYSEGEIVWRKNTKLSDLGKNYSAKLGNKFVKCEIIRRMGSNTYEVKDVDSNRVAIYHTMLLKRK